MTAEMLFVFALLFVTIAVFISDKIRMDMVALLVVAVLALSGIITPAEAVSGFGNTLVLMIAGLFVVGEAMMYTGIAAAAGNWITRVGGGNEIRLLLILLPIVAFLSAFMSSTGTVALLIPVVLTMARKAQLNPSKLLMPLAFSASIGGLLTLIGTPPNIVVSQALGKAGFDNFKFFDFTGLGLIMLAIGVVYLLTLGRWLLPLPTVEAPRKKLLSLARLTERYRHPNRELYKLTVANDSAAIGKTVLELRMRRRYETALFAIDRRSAKLPTLTPVLLNTTIMRGDSIWVYGDDRYIETLCEELSLTVLEHTLSERVRLQKSFGFAEVLIPPDISFAGKTLFEARFREHYNLNVIGVRRDQAVLDMDFLETPLKSGDVLLLTGAWEHIRRLSTESDLIVLNTPAELEEIPLNPKKAPTALTIMALLLVVMAFGWVSNVTAILVAAIAMVLSGCLSLNEAYKSLNATSLVLIAGMLPMALAMEKSGAMGFVVEHLVQYFETGGPLLLSAVIFVLTSVLSLFISNTATAVLVAPMALSTALSLNYHPQPFMMVVAIAASTAFATPIATPINTLVVGPGHYRFSDFIKIGLPLQLIMLLATLLVVPLFYPFQ